MFNGIGVTPDNMFRLSNAVSRSISAENPNGAVSGGALATDGLGAGNARRLGKGWKISPAMNVEPGATFTLADISGSGAIQSMWLGGCVSRDFILRFYWDDQEQPSVECPLPDFFAAGWTNAKNALTADFAQLASIMVSVNPNKAMNCFWTMPFRKHALITVENRSPETRCIFYQINYTLGEVPEDAAYFHAQFRCALPLEAGKDYVLLDGVHGKGQYVGTALSVGLNGPGRWWGEGEVKFFLDGESDPTICGTGTEDYFLGSYDWDVGGEYRTYNSPYAGMFYVKHPHHYDSQTRFSMYRWHVVDPIRFEKSIKVTIQDLGWSEQGGYMLRRDDFYSVSYWYQTLDTAPFPKLPPQEQLEIL